MTTSSGSTTYDTDFYTWPQDQAELLWQGRWAELDIHTLIEEIESLGRCEYRSLVSAIEQLTLHLLKWQYQPEKRTPTILKQRIAISDTLEENPGLKSKLAEVIAKGCRNGHKSASKESRIPLTTFPEGCPYTWEPLTDEDWLPD